MTGLLHFRVNWLLIVVEWPSLSFLTLLPEVHAAVHAATPLPLANAHQLCHCTFFCFHPTCVFILKVNFFVFSSSLTRLIVTCLFLTSNIERADRYHVRTGRDSGPLAPYMSIAVCPCHSHVPVPSLTQPERKGEQTSFTPALMFPGASGPCQFFHTFLPLACSTGAAGSAQTPFSE